ncbi:MAG: extracellular solute-binding protein [Lachnospiraceae bacterium]|nr:extracellular solute-binding protein [Lachnospiraceae bacterium]
MKMKKLVALMATAAMTLSLTACGGAAEEPAAPAAPAADTATEAPAAEETPAATEDAAASEDFDYGTGSITIWAADNVVDLTQKLADQFIADKGVDYTVVVEACGEGDAASNMITDVEAGADIYGFAQDQLARLVAAGALQPLNTEFGDWVTANNDAGSVNAATAGSTIYAFPLTSDNGYFLYYDKSVVTDPSSLEKVLEDCEAAGKNFYMDADSAWYNAAFFFATGANCTFDTDDSGAFTATTASYASPEGLVAYKAMINMIESPIFVDGSAAGEATNVGAIVDGTWDSSALQDILGDNYACAKLPTFRGSDGKDYQLSGFGGFKLMGVKPQTEGGKLKLCYELAQYLSDTDAQLARFTEQGWGPSNVAAQQDSAVKADPALTALAEQLAYTIPQGQYPGEWWDLAGALGKDVESGTITSSSSDDDLMAELKIHDDGCAGFIQ